MAFFGELGISIFGAVSHGETRPWYRPLRWIVEGSRDRTPKDSIMPYWLLRHQPAIQRRRNYLTDGGHVV